MTATIVRFDADGDARLREHRLLELVRDLSGAPAPEAAAAFHHAPESPAGEPLERVAHALVQLRRSGSLRIAAYVPRSEVTTTDGGSIVPLPTLHQGASWPRSTRAQLVRSAIRSATSDSMQPTASSIERSSP